MSYSSCDLSNMTCDREVAEVFVWVILGCKEWACGGVGVAKVCVVPAGDAALPGLRKLLPSAQRGGPRQELLPGPPAAGLPHHFGTKLLLFVPRPGECLALFSTPQLARHITPRHWLSWDT